MTTCFIGLYEFLLLWINNLSIILEEKLWNNLRTDHMSHIRGADLSLDGWRDLAVPKMPHSLLWSVNFLNFYIYIFDRSHLWREESFSIMSVIEHCVGRWWFDLKIIVSTLYITSWPRFGKVYGFTGQEVVFGLLVKWLGLQFREMLVVIS